MRTKQRRFRSRPIRIQIGPKPQDDVLRVQFLARIERRAVLGTASALHAGERLEGIELSDILAGHETEIFVSGQFRKIGKSLAFQEHGGGAEDQMQVLGMRNQR